MTTKKLNIVLLILGLSLWGCGDSEEDNRLTEIQESLDSTLEQIETLQNELTTLKGNIKSLEIPHRDGKGNNPPLSSNQDPPPADQPPEENQESIPESSLTGRFVFASGGEDSDIIVINADGTNRTNLTFDGWKNTSPAWSPNGDRIAFVSNRELEQGQGMKENLIVMNSDGTNLTPITDLHLWPVGKVMWSPDAAFIAFYRTDFGGGNADSSGIYVARMGQEPVSDFRHFKQLTIGGQEMRQQVLSPDWTQIAFVRFMQDTRTEEVFVMPAEGGEPMRLTFHGGSWPAWSPDSMKIVYTGYTAIRDGNDTKHNPDIYVMNTDGSNQINLTATPEDNEEYPQWSPDGRHIAYRSDRNFVNSRGEHIDSAIWVMNTDGSNQTRLDYLTHLWVTPDWGD